MSGLVVASAVDTLLDAMARMFGPTPQVQEEILKAKKKDGKMQKFFVYYSANDASGKPGDTRIGYTFAKNRGEALERAQTKAGKKNELLDVWICEAFETKSRLEQILGKAGQTPRPALSMLAGVRTTYLAERNEQQSKSKKARRKAARENKPHIKLQTPLALPPPKPEAKLYQPYARMSADEYKANQAKEKV